MPIAILRQLENVAPGSWCAYDDGVEIKYGYVVKFREHNDLFLKEDKQFAHVGLPGNTDLVVLQDCFLQPELSSLASSRNTKSSITPNNQLRFDGEGEFFVMAFGQALTFLVDTGSQVKGRPGNYYLYSEWTLMQKYPDGSVREVFRVVPGL